jgi:phospholipid-binding lipoprotein MlaA
MIGPTNARDLSGFGADIATDPLSWITGGVVLSAADWGRFGLNTLDTRANLLDPVAQIKKGALDPYATFRSLYRQHRDAEIDEVRNDTRATIPVWFDQPNANPASSR